MCVCVGGGGGLGVVSSDGCRVAKARREGGSDRQVDEGVQWKSWGIMRG